MMSLTSSLANADTRGPYVFRTVSLIPAANVSILGTATAGNSLPAGSTKCFTTDTFCKCLHIGHVRGTSRFGGVLVPSGRSANLRQRNHDLAHFDVRVNRNL